MIWVGNINLVSRLRFHFIRSWGTSLCCWRQSCSVQSVVCGLQCAIGKCHTDPLVVAVAQCSGLKKALLGFKWGCCFYRRVANVAQVPCSLHLTLLHDCVNFPWLVKLFLAGKRMSFPAMATTSQTDILSMRKQPTFGDVTTGFPAKWRLRNGGRNSILITRHYPDLGSASDWSNQISHAPRPIRSTTQIWVVTRHQYWISHTSFRGETSGGVAKCRLFSQAKIFWGDLKYWCSFRIIGSKQQASNNKCLLCLCIRLLHIYNILLGMVLGK